MTQGRLDQHTPLRIGVDVRPAAHRERRGIGHYTVEVMSAMLQHHGAEHEWKLLCLGADPAQIPDSLMTSNVHLEHRRVGKLTFHHLAARGLRRWDDRRLEPVDVFFVPSAHMLAIDPKTPLVMTVHDTFFAAARHLMSRRERLWHRIVDSERLLRQARRLLANSEHTANGLKELLPEVADRVVVIPLGVDSVYKEPLDATTAQAVRARLGICNPYVLYMGGVEPRKNVRRLLKSFALARRRGLQHELVIAGPLTRDASSELREVPMDHVRLLGFVAERDKPVLYSGATLLAMPSLDEGLGLPPLEALACGTPSMVSDIPVFGETLGSAAMAVDPYDEDEMATALVELCSDDGLRRRLIARGSKVLERHDWGVCAQLTYHELVSAGEASVGNGTR